VATIYTLLRDIERTKRAAGSEVIEALSFSLMIQLRRREELLRQVTRTAVALERMTVDLAKVTKYLHVNGYFDALEHVAPAPVAQPTQTPPTTAVKPFGWTSRYRGALSKSELTPPDPGRGWAINASRTVPAQRPRSGGAVMSGSRWAWPSSYG
jgi:hypothetical protein